jgi:hypothetical protein
MRVSRPLPSVDLIRARLSYDRESGQLIWLPCLQMSTTWNSRYAGKEAGCVTPLGYRVVAIGKTLFMAHRLAYAHFYGLDPETGIDHADGDRLNNAIANLRPATKSQNAINSRVRSDNKAGVRGVSWRRNRAKWRARIKVDGREIALGCFEKIADADAAYVAAARRYHGEFSRSVPENKRAQT